MSVFKRNLSKEDQTYEFRRMTEVEKPRIPHKVPKLLRDATFLTTRGENMQFPFWNQKVRKFQGQTFLLLMCFKRSVLWLRFCFKSLLLTHTLDLPLNQGCWLVTTRMKWNIFRLGNLYYEPSISYDCIPGPGGSINQNFKSLPTWKTVK